MTRGTRKDLTSRRAPALSLSRTWHMRGFDRKVFAEMMGTLRRFADDEFPLGLEHVADIRRFFADWAAGLRT
jgi:hypothetical protein